MNEFRNYLKYYKRLSIHTVDGYCNDVNTFALWGIKNLENHKWETTTRADVDRYVMMLSEQGLSASSINRKLTSLSAFFRFRQREGLQSENPVRFVSRQKREKRVPTTIDTEELNTAYRHATGEGRLILGLFCTTGMRLSELLNIKAGDIDIKHGNILIFGKGRQERVVYPKGCVMEELARHIADLPKESKVFDYTPRGTRSLVYTLLKPYCTANQLSPHAIRHTYATHLALKGTPTSEIAALLGHNDLGSAQHYIDYAQHIKAGERTKQ